MHDETTPAPAPAPPVAAAPRLPRANTKALRRLREPIRPQNIAKRPIVYCWDCQRADENRPGDTCTQHVSRWCNTCRSYISNAHNHQGFVGHPEVTDRFLDADLKWNWRPMAFDDRGLPQLDDDGGMWIYLMIGGVERPAYGKPGEGGAVELISNSLTNGGIRFGVALNQRAKTDLHAPDTSPGSKVCPGCETSCDGAARFCSDCGHQLPTMEDGDKVCPGCETSCDGAARFCSDCGHQLPTGTTAEPEYARPDWIARVNSQLARKRGVYGPDRLRELSEILQRDVTDVTKLSPDEAREVVQILSGTPDLKPSDPTVEAEPTPVAEPAAAAPPAEPAPTPARPQPSPRRAGAATRTSKSSTAQQAKAPAGAGPGAAHVRTINSLLNSRGVPVNDVPARMSIISAALKRTVQSLDEISPAEALAVIHGLGSGDVPVGPPSAAADAAADDAEATGVVGDLMRQIMQAITDEDASHIKVEIGKALTAGLITRADGRTLSDQLEERGRQVGLAGTS